jgi:hypothetical protein
MVKIIPDNCTFKVINVEYEKDDFKKIIEINVLTTSNLNDEKNVGTILEKYRSDEPKSNDYFKSNKSNLEKFIKGQTKPFDQFSPDGIICVDTNDENIQELLLIFKQSLTSEIKSLNEIDHSKSFYKTDKSKSIKKNNLKDSDFKLEIRKSEPFKNLLIIDDVIDKGKTLEILLNKLLFKKLISSHTTIKMGCIYNRPKMDTLLFMDVLKKM